MQTLEQDIKKREFKRVYLLYGEENFLKRSYKNRLKEAILGDDTMNFHHFEGKGIDIPEIIGLADTMPFFAEKRLLLLEDSGLFKGSAEQLASYLPQLPESTCMLFVESEVDKRGKLYKAVKKTGYAAEMVRQTTSQLANWSARLLAKEGKKITGATMELFLEKTGDDMENIRSELDKLISYTLGRDVITSQDVEAICTTQLTDKIFEMVSAISSRKIQRAMELYEDLLLLREPPMRLLFLIARQFNQLLMIKDMAGKGVAKAEMASGLKLPPFVVGKLLTQSRAFTREQLLSYLELCVEAEESVKQGRLQDRLAVEILICKKI